MKKILLLTIFTLLLMHFGAMATETRVLTMGENNNILQDDANIWLYPSKINSYPDLAFAEISHTRYLVSKGLDIDGYISPVTRFGINWKFGGDKPWVLGTYFHNNDRYGEFPYDQLSIIPSFDIMPWHGPYWDGTDVQSYSNRRFDLFWGYLFGENQFGLRFGYVHSSNKDDEEDDMDERGSSKYDFNLGLTMMEGKLDIAAGIELFTFTYKETYNKGTVAEPDYTTIDYYKPEGNSTLFARLRYFYEYNPTYTFVPHAEVKFGKFEWGQYDWVTANLDDTLDYSEKYNYTTFDLGIGMHYVPTNNVLGVIDFGFKYVKLKREITSDVYDNVLDSVVYRTDEYKYSYMVLPYFKLGMEADIFKWLDVRFGATSYWTKYTNEIDDFVSDTLTYNSKYNEKYPFNNTYLGLGFNFNRLHVDCYVDPELFMDGFYFISGVDSKQRGMNFQISALYEMF